MLTLISEREPKPSPAHNNKMKATKTTKSNGQPKGVWLYGIKKNGERYAKPAFYAWVGTERTPENVKARMERNNPGARFEIAENQEELNKRFA